MNADEIVRALRSCSNHDTRKPDCDNCPLFGERLCVKKMLEGGVDLIESLQAQLAAEKRRADAAVGDLKKLDRREPFGGRNCANKSECYEENRKIGGNYPECANCTERQWRGPQEAGEGERDV